MGKRPSLSEVKEFFKDADIVEDWKQETGFVEFDKIEIPNKCYIQNPFKNNWLVLWYHVHGYAKILTYKNNDMKLSKEFIKANADKTLKEVFPDCFVQKLKFEIGKWYNWQNGGALFNYQPNGKIYGFLYGNWHITDSWAWDDTKNVREATNEEIFEALKSEAVNRNFVDGVYYKHNEYDKIRQVFGSEYKYHSNDNTLRINGFALFSKGEWCCKLIPTITKEEAEKLLNKKII